jgi:hypothetical protein
MRGATNQELSSAAIHQILRGIAERDWTKLDQTAAAAEAHPVSVDAPVQDDVFEEIQQNDDPMPFPVSRGGSSLHIPSPAGPLARWAFPDGAPIGVIRWSGPRR